MQTDLRATPWYQRNTYHHAAYPAERLAAARELTVSVCLPARNEARTIGPILERLLPLREIGVVDQIAVVDGSSDDETADIARRIGAEVYDQAALLPEHGPVLGKGDAMWRALAILSGDVVCFLDADSEQFGAHFACGLLGPLVCERDIALVKGFYRRPFRMGEVILPHEGGRVTELTARPLLNLFYGAIAQVDLDVRQNAHQSLRELGAMASEVLQAVVSRLRREGRIAAAFPEAVERPPIQELRAAA
jgi:glucosyl-3-phosphoglycerate synthase